MGDRLQRRKGKTNHPKYAQYCTADDHKEDGEPVGRSRQPERKTREAAQQCQNTRRVNPAPSVAEHANDRSPNCSAYIQQPNHIRSLGAREAYGQSKVGQREEEHNVSQHAHKGPRQQQNYIVPSNKFGVEAQLRRPDYMVSISYDQNRYKVSDERKDPRDA